MGVVRLAGGSLLLYSPVQITFETESKASVKAQLNNFSKEKALVGISQNIVESSSVANEGWCSGADPGGARVQGVAGRAGQGGLGGGGLQLPHQLPHLSPQTVSRP